MKLSTFAPPLIRDGITLMDIITFDNGLRLVHVQREAKVAYLGLALNTGSRDEEPDQHGMAHLIEHMLFKGTHKRNAWHVLNRMESVGADLNAYTGKEETTIYSTFLPQYYERSIELISDIVFNSSYPHKELIKEKEVVLDEINSYLDSPSELIYDEFEELLFPHDSIGRGILGSPESLSAFDSQSLQSFVQHNYFTGSPVIFSYGNIQLDKLIRWIEKYFPYSFQKDSRQRTKPTPYKAQELIKTKDTYQAHVIMGTRAYPLHHKRRLSLYLLNHILGGTAMNSKLNLALREKRGYVYQVDSSVTSYTDSGVFAIYFGTDKTKVDKCINLVNKEIKLICNDLLTTSKLAGAKKQLLSQIAISADFPESHILNIGKSILHFNSFNSIPEIVKLLDKIDSAQIRDVANEVLATDQLSCLSYV